MSLPALVESLKSCGRMVLEHAPEVNHGGCGVYAAKVAMALQDRGIEVWGVISSPLRNDDLNIVRNESNPRTVRQWNDAGVIFNHVLVQFEHRGRIYTHDARNTSAGKLKREPTFGGLICPGYLTVPEMVTLAAHPKGWNSAFDRKAGIPVIKKAIRRFLNF